MEGLFSCLEDRGVQIVESPEQRTEVDTEDGSRLDDSVESGSSDLSSIPVDDPISLYFAEMTRDPLLERDVS